MSFYRGRYYCPQCLCLLSEYSHAGKRRCFNDRCGNYGVGVLGVPIH